MKKGLQNRKIFCKIELYCNEADQLSWLAPSGHAILFPDKLRVR